MDFLSLNEPSPPAPAAKLRRSDAMLVSGALHLIVALLLFWLPSRLPATWPALLRPRHAIAAPPAPASPPAAGRDAIRQPVIRPEPPIPVQFAYVKVPDDETRQPDKEVRLRSDRDRRARQETPTPADARLFTRDPHSEGTSAERLRPDPRLRAGRDEPEPAPAPLEEGRSAGGAGTKTEEAAAVPPTEGQAPATRDRRAGAPGPGEGPGGEGRDGDAPRTIQEALSGSDGAESKFQFSNPGFLRAGGLGTLSFDTADFPWGDYARKIYVIIRDNWYDRYPLAAREGIRGYVCERFIIARDGTVAQITPTRPSGVPPFDKAAADALRASSRLPPLPDEFSKDEEGVTACFFYNLYPAEVE